MIDYNKLKEHQKVILKVIEHVKNGGNISILPLRCKGKSILYKLLKER